VPDCTSPKRCEVTLQPVGGTAETGPWAREYSVPMECSKTRKGLLRINSLRPAITGEVCLGISRILAIAADSRAALVDPTCASGLFAGALVRLIAEIEKKKVLVD
jgi:hypothetical protein